MEINHTLPPASANVNATQSAPNAGPADPVQRPAYRFLDRIETSVAGCYFHEATGAIGDTVYRTRDPGNPADPNALAVLNGGGEQIGYVPYRLAEALAPNLGKGLITLTGESAYGDRPEDELPDRPPAPGGHGLRRSLRPMAGSRWRCGPDADSRRCPAGRVYPVTAHVVVRHRSCPRPQPRRQPQNAGS
jgi:hypothetical protein